VLRVDELAKLGGERCMHQTEGAGCALYAVRPGICRAYRCAWLRGAFEDVDRPDRLGAVLDLVPRGDGIRLVIRQARPDAFDRSPRLQAIAQELRSEMLVEIRDVEDVLAPGRRYRVLEAGDRELVVSGDRIEVVCDGRTLERRRVPWLERAALGITRRWQAWRLSRWPSHEELARRLGEPRSGGPTGGSDARR
jgi:Fe-S-cluster containining protein